MKNDNENLLKELVKLKALVDQLTVVFHKIDLNPRAECYTDPIEWGQKYAKFSFPLSERVPTHSGMHLPIFHVLSTQNDANCKGFGRISWENRVF
jgi:hypothetical protein